MGELVVDLSLFSTPGLVAGIAFSVRHRSMDAGATQVGARVIPSWEWTLNQTSPTSIDIRHPSGIIDTYLLIAGIWAPQTCNVTNALTPVGGAMAMAAGGAACAVRTQVPGCS